MATSMARRSCVFCCTGINAIRQHVPPLNALCHLYVALIHMVFCWVLERLTVSYSRSSGPGGQHVNKVSTKAEVRFHVQTAEWIPEDVRKKILEKNKNRITKAGELLVTSELSRSQQRNLSDCIQKISTIIAEASEKPHEPTAEDIALRAARSEKRNKERLRQKKIHSATKQSRRVDFD
uniref:Large ribosomal subunit protein mL62 n=1 Tax=Amphilophus citrinellus TaxID=61819 RepID=A0A3Q0SPZ4_AMPCI